MTDYWICVSEIIYKLTDYWVWVVQEYESGSWDLIDYRIACPSCSNVFEEVYFWSVEQAIDYFNLHKDDVYFWIWELDWEEYWLWYWLDYIKNK